jgi:hypothetical protein
MAHFVCKFRVFFVGRKLARIRISLKDHCTLSGMKVDLTALAKVRRDVIQPARKSSRQN